MEVRDLNEKSNPAVSKETLGETGGHVISSCGFLWDVAQLVPNPSRTL